MSTTTRRFSVRTAPLIAEVGDDLVLKFKPEVGGTEYLDAYEVLLNTQGEASKVAEEEPAKAAMLRIRSTLDFLKELALPETRAILEDETVVIPLRILTQVVEWLTGEYSGSAEAEGKAAGARPTSRRSG